jgi:Fe2+ transport system protein FeoA
MGEPSKAKTMGPVGTLDRVPVGASVALGRARHVDATILRLLEMGMSEGAVVTVTRRALFGDPLEIHVRGTKLCLRREDAARFPCRPPAPPTQSTSEASLPWAERA